MDTTVKVTKEESEILSNIPLSAVDVLFDISRIRFIIEDGKVTGLEV